MPSPFPIAFSSIADPAALTERFMLGLRRAGHPFDVIALALAEGAVDALIADGFPAGTLRGGVNHLFEAMRDHAAAYGAKPSVSAPPSRPAALRMAMELRR